MKKLIWAIILMVFTPSSLYGQEPIQIEGRVIDSLSQQPIRGITVVFPYEGMKAETDGNGVFYFTLKKERMDGTPRVKIMINETDYAVLDSTFSIGSDQKLSGDIMLSPVKGYVITGRLKPFQNWAGVPCTRVPYRIRVSSPQGEVLYEDTYHRYDLDFRLRNIDLKGFTKISMRISFENKALFNTIDKHNIVVPQNGFVIQADFVSQLVPGTNNSATVDKSLSELEGKMLSILKSRQSGKDFSSDVKPLFYNHTWLMEYAMFYSQNSPSILQVYRSRRQAMRDLYAAYFKSYVDELNKDLLQFCHQSNMGYCYDSDFLQKPENATILTLFKSAKIAYSRWFEVTDCPTYDPYVNSYREEFRRVSEALNQ